MPGWTELLGEINESINHIGPRGFDAVRRKYLKELHNHTNRSVILYASGWMHISPTSSQGADFSIHEGDLSGFMDVCHALQSQKGHESKQNEVDLILHSPGGAPTAAEAIVKYLRSNFSGIRVIVPNFAMSAATMMACAADEIVLGSHSFLGPIDPQVGGIPAHSIIDQFRKAQDESSDAKKFRAWIPILNQYQVGLISQCESAIDLSKELAKTWLEDYMFKNEKDASGKAAKIADWLGNYDNFKNHGKPISREEAASRGLKVVKLEDDKKLEDLVLSVFYSVTHTFNGTPTSKIIENHNGRASLKIIPTFPSAPPQV